MTIYTWMNLNLQIDDDTPSSVYNYIARGVEGFSKVLRNKNDIFILLGDRYELLAAATAVIHKVPIGHIHGVK